MTETTVQTANDVVDFLVGQHNEIKRLFSETLRSRDGNHRDEAFVELRRLLAVHETAEEMVVHPAARRNLAFGNGIVDARLEEENEAKKHLAELESMDIDSEEFVDLLIKLQSAVLEHAEHEEQEEFSALREVVEPKQLRMYTAAVRAAEKLAPTRPHAGVELATVNFAVGPFAAMIDRARDAIKQATAD